MYIIDKNKDYYDHISYTYGVDKKVVYDRRGSTQLTDEDLYNLVRGRRHFMYNHKYLLLEVGFTQYLIKPTNIQVHMSDVATYTVFDSLDLELIHTYKEHRNYFEEPMSLRWCYVNHEWDSLSNIKLNLQGRYEQDIVGVGSNPQWSFPEVYTNPILKDTSITSIISGDEIWKELQNYISSLNNDKDCSTLMTDVEKAEVHGFDKKKSFRYRK